MQQWSSMFCGCKYDPSCDCWLSGVGQLLPSAKINSFLTLYFSFFSPNICPSAIYNCPNQCIPVLTLKPVLLFSCNPYNWSICTSVPSLHNCKSDREKTTRGTLCAEAWISEGFVCGCLHAATAENAALDKFLSFVNSVCPHSPYFRRHMCSLVQKRWKMWQRRGSEQSSTRHRPVLPHSGWEGVPGPLTKKN